MNDPGLLGNDTDRGVLFGWADYPVIMEKLMVRQRAFLMSFVLNQAGAVADNETVIRFGRRNSGPTDFGVEFRIQASNEKIQLRVGKPDGLATEIAALDDPLDFGVDRFVTGYIDNRSGGAESTAVEAWTTGPSALIDDNGDSGSISGYGDIVGGTPDDNEKGVFIGYGRNSQSDVEDDFLGPHVIKNISIITWQGSEIPTISLIREELAKSEGVVNDTVKALAGITTSSISTAFNQQYGGRGL